MGSSSFCPSSMFSEQFGFSVSQVIYTALNTIVTIKVILKSDGCNLFISLGDKFYTRLQGGALVTVS